VQAWRHLESAMSEVRENERRNENATHLGGAARRNSGDAADQFSCVGVRGDRSVGT
jgi:hypothetical protein